MAGDIRDPSSNPNSNSPDSSLASKSTSVNTTQVYETFPNTPESTVPLNSNQDPPGPSLPPSWSQGWRTVRWQDFSQVHMYPCVRESGLTGFGVGFGVGGLRALFGAPIPKVANWAAGALVFGALISYEFCQYRRRIEMTYVKRAVQIMESKKAQQEEKMIKRRQEIKEQREKEAAEEKRRKSWW